MTHDSGSPSGIPSMECRVWVGMPMIGLRRIRASLFAAAGVIPSAARDLVRAGHEPRRQDPSLRSG